MVFCGQAEDVAHPFKCYMDQYDEHGNMSFIEMGYLPLYAYPWGVCCYGTSNGGEQLSNKQKDWAIRAMATWNYLFDEYKMKNWGKYDVVTLPNKLFIASCDSKKYNMAYVFLSDELSDKVWGRYIPVDRLFDFTDFYAIILANENIKDQPPLFTYTIMHELGHVLGIPHLKHSQTNIMRNEGTGCDIVNGFCKIKDTVFDYYIWQFGMVPAK